MGFSVQERVNLNSKVLQADVMDALSSAVWFESRLFAGKVIDARQTWTEFATLETLPAANLAAAQANALANPTLIQDLSAPVDAVRLTEVTATNNSTYVALSIFGDFTSTRLKNWLQPQQVPQASGAASNGYSIRLFNGDPNGGGTEIFTTDGQTGVGINKSPGWVWNYSNGILLIADDFYAQTGINAATFDPYVLGFRYVGPTAGTGATDAERVTLDVNQVAHGFSVGEAVYFDGVQWQLAQANAAATLSTHLVYRVLDVDNFTLIQSGYMTGFVGLNPGDYYFVSPAVPGALQATDPSTTSPLFFSNPIVLAETATSGWVLPWRAFGPGALSGGVLVSTITTVNAVPVAGQTITLPTDGVLLLITKVLAREQAPNLDRATYIRTTRVNVTAGTPTILAPQTDYTSEDDVAWDVTFSVAGPSIEVVVTGDPVNVVDWRITTEVQVL